jgi:hypothetical protein
VMWRLLVFFPRKTEESRRIINNKLTVNYIQLIFQLSFAVYSKLFLHITSRTDRTLLAGDFFLNVSGTCFC